MKRKICQISALGVMALLTARPAAATPFSWIQNGVSGSQIKFDSDGNIYLEGKCFGNVSSSFCANRSMPTGEIIEWYNREAVAKDGNLFFSGTISREVASPPTSGATWGNPAIASITDSGGKANLSVRHQCKNVAGCSDTVFEPAKWNNCNNPPNDCVQTKNNCYNYGNDKITNTYAQPGRASGHEGPYPPTCDSVDDAVTWDGLIRVGPKGVFPPVFPGNNYDCGNGHLIFMAVGGRDYHWWRLDQITGRWSQKPADGAAGDKDYTGPTYYDWNGNPICDPINSNRGQYTTPCYFYCTCGGLANIN
jgi:hypothetical protein